MLKRREMLNKERVDKGKGDVGDRQTVVDSGDIVVPGLCCC